MDSKTFISLMAKRLGLTNVRVNELIDALVGVIRTHSGLREGVALPGLGTFTLLKHDERVKADRATGRRTLLPPRLELVFSPAARLLKASMCQASYEVDMASLTSTYTLREAAPVIAQACETTVDTVNAMVATLGDIIGETLGRGHSVTIPRLGTYSRSSDDFLRYTPDSELARAVNQPFDFFEPVDIAPGVDITSAIVEDTTKTSAEEAPEATQEKEILPPPQADLPNSVLPIQIDEIAEVVAAIQATSVAEEVPADGPRVNTPRADEQAPFADESASQTDQGRDAPQVHPLHADEEVAESEPEPETAPQPEAEPEPSAVLPALYQQPGTASETARVRRSNTALIATLCLLLGIIGGCVAGFFSYVPLRDHLCRNDVIIDTVRLQPVYNTPVKADTLPADTLTPVATAEPATTPPQEDEKPRTPAKIYDTVTKTRFLATLARKHYGQSIYWVYIYEANRKHLPSRVALIAPGTRVEIPPIEKYLRHSSRDLNLRDAEILADSLLRQR